MYICYDEHVAPISCNTTVSTQKTFWEGKFTGEENFTLGELSDVNMKNCGRHNVRKHREIKGSDKYVTLEILLKFGSLYKTRITYSDPKYNFGKIRKGVDYLSGSKGQSRAKEIQKCKVYHLEMSL